MASGLQNSLPGNLGLQGAFPGGLQGLSPAAIPGYGTGGVGAAFPGGVGAGFGLGPSYYPGVYMQAPAGALPYAAYASPQMQMHRPAVSPLPSGRRHFGAEQAGMGVRVNEFHGLSVHAPYVPPSVALQLQLLWDNGNQLVSLLDDGSWRALTELEANAGMQVVNEVAEAMTTQTIRNVNAYLIAIAKKHLNIARSGGLGMLAAAPPAGPGHYKQYSGLGAAAASDPYAAMLAGSMAGLALAGAPAGYVALGGGGGGGGMSSSGQKGVAAVHKLHGALLQRAQVLLEQHNGVLREQHFDEVVVNHLLRLPEPDAMEVLNEVGRHELISVKNIPAYVMGIISRVRREGSGARGL